MEGEVQKQAVSGEVAKSSAQQTRRQELQEQTGATNVINRPARLGARARVKTSEQKEDFPEFPKLPRPG